MTTQQVLDEIRRIISSHTGDEKELYEELDAEAEGWRMRLQELEEDEIDFGGPDE